jgi:transcriptional regulator of acetoin/glycerol metabolism
MITITPVSQDNKGRFNRRTITLTHKSDRNCILIGTTDTGKKVAVYVFAFEYEDHKEYTVAVQYQAVETDAYYGRRYNWGNQYLVTKEEFDSLKSI